MKEFELLPAKLRTIYQFFKHVWPANQGPSLVERVYDEALLQDRHSVPASMVVSQPDESWSTKDVIAGMKKWTSMMTEEHFCQGSWIDKSVYAYSVYMLVTHGWLKGSGWTVDALEQVVTWFGKLV